MNEIEKRVAENKKKREEAKNPPPQIEKGQVKVSKWVWMACAVVIDLITGYAVATITTDWYGGLWIAAGAGGLIYAEWLRERVGNNTDQRKISELGVGVSAVSVLLMAGLAGSMYVLGMTKLAWVEVVVLLSTIGLFCYHAFQSYRYHVKDDDYLARSEEAREIEVHERNLRELDRAAREVEHAKLEEYTKAGYRREHGGAFDAALGQTYAQTAAPVQDRTNVPLENRNSSVKSENPAQTRPEVRYHLKDLLDASGKSVKELAEMEQKAFGVFVSGSFDEINSYNINVLWSEVRAAYKKANPTQAGSRSQ